MVDIISSTEENNPFVRAARPELAMLVALFFQHGRVTRLCRLPERETGPTRSQVDVEVVMH